MNKENCKTNSKSINLESFLKKITPKEVKKYTDTLPYYGHCNDEYNEGFLDGVKWLKKQLKNK